MLTGEPRSSAELMSVPTLLSWLGTLRQVDARRRHDRFCEQLAAARGEEKHIRKITDALTIASGSEVRRTGRDVNAFERWLTGGM
jgi:hypothetical protein